MGIIFWVVVLLVVAVVNRRRRAPKKVKLLYPGGVGRMVGEWIVFPCNCRFHAGTQARFLCAAHDAIFAAEAAR
jgi:hypothetical protein